MNHVHIICVGKYKNKALEKLEEHYLKQLQELKLKIIELKTFGEDTLRETKEISQALEGYDQNRIFLLTEQGKSFTTPQFTSFIQDQMQRSKKPFTFVLSGAIGFPLDFKKKYQSISLSALTFPHKLARLLLVEQIYRAQAIMKGHPYHN